VVFVLIRTDDVFDFIALRIILPLYAACPETGNFNQKLTTAAVHEIIIAGGLVVQPDTPGNIRRDMLLDHTCQNRAALAGDDIRTAVKRRHFAVVQPCTLPGEHSTLIAILAGLFERAGQAAPAVAQQGLGGGGVSQQVVRHQEHLGIPERMTFVALACHALGTDANAVIIALDHNVQVIQRKPHTQLVKAVIAFDLHILLCPVSCPLFGGGCKQSVITGIRKLCRQRITGSGNDVRVRCAALLTVDRKRQVTACVVAGQLFDAQRLLFCQPERVAPHKAAALNDRQRLGRFCAEFVQAVYTDRHIALIRMGHKAQDATGQHPHFALHTVLRAGIAVAGRDTAIDDQLDILIRRCDFHRERGNMLIIQRNKATEGQFQRCPGRAFPLHGARCFAGAQIQCAQVALQRTLIHGEAFTVDDKLHSSHVRQVGQLGHFVGHSLIECARDKSAAVGIKVTLLQRAADVDIAVALGKDGFTFGGAARVKGFLCHDPAAGFEIIFHSRVSFHQPLTPEAATLACT